MRASFSLIPRYARWDILDATAWKVCLLVILVGAHVTSAASQSPPSPLSIPASREWLGYDGIWNPIYIRVGNPPQFFNVLPNTRSSEILVIDPKGCDSSMECRTERGGLFYTNESNTWAEVGRYEMGYNLPLGLTGSADYGYDCINIDEETRVSDQVVGLISTVKWYIGSLGLGVIGTNFTDGVRRPFINTLVQNQSLIPSHSYGYTAGAHYRSKGVPTSLTFGGVDKNRFVHNDISFTLSPDKLPAVSLRSIGLSKSLQPNSTRGSDPNIVADENNRLYIDSSTPFLWFPEKTCDLIANNLDLVYNETLQLYTYGNDSSKYEILRDSNVSLTFTLSDLPDSQDTVDIELPFSAFDNKLSFPYPDLNMKVGDAPIRYFPLRRARSPRDYAIGRVFLQEAYLTVDYERGNFSISQAKFPSDPDMKADLVEITRPPDSRYPGPQYSSDDGLSIGAKVGIGVGVAIGIIIILIAFIAWIHRRKRNSSPHPQASKTGTRKKWTWRFWKTPSHQGPAELLADKRYPVEAQAGSSVTRFELPAQPPAELEGSRVPLGEKFEVEANGPRENQPPIKIVPIYDGEESPRTEADESYIVSPIAPSSTQGYLTGDFTQSLGVPSPITPTTGNSSAGSYSKNEGYPDSHLPPLTASQMHATEGQLPVNPNSRDEERGLQHSGSRPDDDRRRFSWESDESTAAHRQQ